MRHGTGTLTYKNGSVYEGQWERGMKWGQGKMTYASGNYYDGQWANNKRNGQGTMFWLTSDEKYEGNWEDNFQSGFGAHIWLDGTTDSKLLRNRYVGYWRLGQRHGKGTFYYSNGSKYEGEWKENFKHGAGTFTFEDGTQYVGPFENDRMVNRAVPQKDAAALALQPQAGGEEGQTGKKDAKGAGAKKAGAKKGGDAAASSKAGGKAASGAASATAGASGLGGTTQSRFAAGRAKKEVEENPFRKLIDISDLMELENSPEETLKEVQNILLRHNSELKQWYRIYSRKIEAHKCEESFAMTLRQVWRFLRDTHLVSANSTLAQFDRVYNEGVKNHFTLLGSKDQDKFDKMYGVSKPGTGAEGEGGASAQPKAGNISDEEDEEEEVIAGEGGDKDAEDTHDALKIVLQRQFFEAVARAASVRYASGSDALPTLSHKLQHLFESNFGPLAVKNKSKTIEDEKAFKVADKVLEEYSEELTGVFNHFSSKSGNMTNGRKDSTLQVNELLQMLEKTNLLDGKTSDLKLEDVVHLLEKYYAPEGTLKAKLAQENFEQHLKANPMLLRVNQEAAAKKLKAEEATKRAEARRLAAEEAGEEQPPEEEEPAQEDPEEELDEEAKAARDEAELEQLRADWGEQVLSEHLVYINGVELVYFEFKELLLELALRLKD